MEGGFREAHRIFFAQLTFFLWYVFQKVSEQHAGADRENGYHRFVRKLKDKQEDFGLINFNYDTLLDRAMQDLFGKSYANELTSYTDGLFPHIKPHGSVNWFLSPRAGDPRISMGGNKESINTRYVTAIGAMFREVPLEATAVQVINPINENLTHPTLIQSVRFGERYFYPLILAPLTSKLYEHFNGFRDSVITPGRKLLSRATEIFLIGYRAADETFVEMVAQVRDGTTLHVVGMADAKEILDRVIQKEPRLSVGTIHTDGFERFTEQY